MAKAEFGGARQDRGWQMGQGQAVYSGQALALALIDDLQLFSAPCSFTAAFSLGLWTSERSCGSCFGSLDKGFELVPGMAVSAQGTRQD